MCQGCKLRLGLTDKRPSDPLIVSLFVMAGLLSSGLLLRRFPQASELAVVAAFPPGAALGVVARLLWGRAGGWCGVGGAYVAATCAMPIVLFLGLSQSLAFEGRAALAYLFLLQMLVLLGMSVPLLGFGFGALAGLLALASPWVVFHPDQPLGEPMLSSPALSSAVVLVGWLALYLASYTGRRRCRPGEHLAVAWAGSVGAAWVALFALGQAVLAVHAAGQAHAAFALATVTSLATLVPAAFVANFAPSPEPAPAPFARR